MDEDALHVESKFEYDGDSHFEFGRLVGERFRVQIRARIEENAKLQTLLLPFYTTPDGQDLYTQYVERHNATFPQYVEELQGMAQGSNLPFETLFLTNIIEEYEDSIPASFHAESVSAAVRRPVLRCSDIVLTSTRLRAVAHNEDGGRNDLNRTAIITARIGSSPKFVAYTYLGDLPSGAFGFNEHGVAFTLNFVQPAETFIGGLGRGFVSRDLLNAANATDAIARITRPKQATGHNFQLMDITTHRVWNIEVASFDRHVIHEFTVPEGAAANNVTAFFHANQYQRLNIAQPPYESSLHRLKRYSELTPPTTVREALAILGDQEDRSWPVFHDTLSHEGGELSGYTMTTIVFDVLEGKAYSFRGNPSRLNVKFIWDLKTLKVTPDSYESQ
uniref:Peptidase C45 hydrolase domain-containing protein n=1 Tax=Globisporangium ultimum (strain ATCC 200006 / CBS 805.95 / DAOM BR144) TaxID=431595 RepID=K3WCK1_GLOUD